MNGEPFICGEGKARSAGGKGRAVTGRPFPLLGSSGTSRAPRASRRFVPTSMPMILRVLVGCVALQLMIDVGALALGWADGTVGTRASELGALVLDLGLLVALLHGDDRMRALLRLGATAGLAIDVVLLVQWWAYAPADGSRLATGGLAGALVAGSAFAVWALGHRDAQAWSFARWAERRGIPAQL